MRRPFYVRLAALTMIGVPVALLVVAALSQVAVGRVQPGILGLLGPVVVLTVPAGLLLLWSNRFLIAAAVSATLLSLLTTLLGSEFGLRHPESFFDFAPALVTSVGPLVALIAAFAALWQRRRGSLGPPGRTPRRALLITAAATGALLVVSAALTVTSRPTVADERGTTRVVMNADRFDPNHIMMRGGRTYRLLLRNEDSYAHTFSVDELGVDQYVGPRAERVVTVTTADDGATYDLYCAVTGHDKMNGTVSIRPMGDSERAERS